MSVCVFPDCCWSVSGGAQPCPAQLTVVILPAPAPARPAWLSPTGELSLSLSHFISSNWTQGPSDSHRLPVRLSSILLTLATA